MLIKDIFENMFTDLATFYFVCLKNAHGMLYENDIGDRNECTQDSPIYLLSLQK